MREMLAMGPREDRAIAYLMVGCLLIFVAQWPRLSRIAYLEGVEMDNGWWPMSLISWLIVWPLLLYAIAAGLHGLMLCLMRQPSQMWSARLVLFWSVLATSPVACLWAGLGTGGGVAGHPGGGGPVVGGACGFCGAGIARGEGGSWLNRLHLRSWPAAP
jgi:hypothetical protein